MTLFIALHIHHYLDINRYRLDIDIDIDRDIDDIEIDDIEIEIEIYRDITCLSYGGGKLHKNRELNGWLRESKKRHSGSCFHRKEATFGSTIICISQHAGEYLAGSKCSSISRMNEG